MTLITSDCAPSSITAVNLARAAALAAGKPFVRPDIMTYVCGQDHAILLHPPLPLAGVSTAMERERQQNGSLADG